MLKPRNHAAVATASDIELPAKTATYISNTGKMRANPGTQSGEISLRIEVVDVAWMSD